MQAIVYTAKSNYNGADVLDISADTKHTTEAGRCLAPTPQLEKARKSGDITAEQFHQSYLQLIRERYSQNKSPFLWLLVAPQLTITCDHHELGKCHCQDAVKVLMGITDAYGIDFFYRGERETGKSKATYRNRAEGWPVMPAGAEF